MIYSYVDGVNAYVKGPADENEAKEPRLTN